MPETTAFKLDQIFVLLKQAILHYIPAPLSPLVSAILSVIPILLVFPALFAITTVLERKGLGRIQNRPRPQSRRPFRLPAAHGRRYQVPHQRGHRPSRRRPSRPPRRAHPYRHRFLPRLRRHPHRTQHGRRQPRLRAALLLRHRLAHGSRRLHGRLVQQKQILAPRSHARHRPDDLLRDAPRALIGRGRHGRRLALDRRHRRRAIRLHRHLSPTGTSSRPGASPASSFS